jgi:hypothetical protein
VADGQKRTISSFLEFAVLQYLSSTQYVDNAEMDEILQDKELVRNLKDGLKELKNGEYSRLSEFQIAETKEFTKCKKALPNSCYEKIRNIVYPQLKKNPYVRPEHQKSKLFRSDRSGEGAYSGGLFEV